MNRILAVPTRVLSRRTLVSSLETGGHAHARKPVALFSAHPAYFRPLGLVLMATAYIPAIYFYYDITFNQRKAETSILVGLFGEEGFLRDLNLCVVFTLTGMVTFWAGRVLFFHNLNIWSA
ncbi:Oidioi.mRNA.OKI2018_I69.PAR.g12273.t1.cds [Oikopleura dioica]|uniref:Oidioi.mRNA.OKI2018_I69.PAR.g12252.t1.cds n=1 Tax=Oikopleura dioica TaxID=34765 RepID=A0ABN7S670_OIKDI|nr:Oidioi.mRNA.OKI2018_I69.PAR.g12252.t1.cds [Oikopleura dioica]CAG5089590.1 Oidioi.mRNA.OKI2018_I69.PAR.g12273.t1.cds [Oikopleura dioica]